MTVKIAILGAGAIGCHAGAAWSGPVSAAGGQITLIGRARVLAPLRAQPLRAGGVAAGPLTLAEDAAAMADADAVVIAVKAHALDAAMEEIAIHARSDAPVLSLLNGLDPVRRLRARFPDRTVIAGMVPFNIVWSGPTTLHRTGAGEIAVERHDLTDWLAGTGARLDLHEDLAPVQHGKLLLNLVGAVNALSGLSLYDTLMQRGYRRVYAAALAEALATYAAAGVLWDKVGPTSPRIGIPVLRAPDWLFRRIVLNRQGLDPASMTSLAADLAAGRPTEVDTINGEICRIGAACGHPTPVNDALVRLIHTAESGGRRRFDAPALMRAVMG